MRGSLTQVGFFHTRGETPRHFQFDHSGQFLIVANQDSDTIAVFSFNLTSGEMKYTGNEYRVPSPNFVCCCPMVDRYSSDEHNNNDVRVDTTTGVTTYVVATSSSTADNNLVPSSVEFSEQAEVGTLTNVDATLGLQVQLELARKEIEQLKSRISQQKQLV